MIPLAIPNLGDKEKEYLVDCVDTTYVSSVGEYVGRLEDVIVKATGSRAAVATSSGTTGLHAALTALGVGRDDLVITPSFTFIATANAITYCGANPWLMDISAEDWCMDPIVVRREILSCCEEKNGQLMHKLLNRRVAAIMPVYTLGNIPNMKEYRRLSDEFGVPLIADAACAIGAKYHGESFGGLADLSILSFNGNKTVTCGGGGAIVGCDEELLHKVKHLTTTGRVWPDYDFDVVGFNYRMTNIQAALGCAQMEKVDMFVDSKRRVRDYYSLRFEKEEIETFPTSEGSSCWLSGVVLRNGNKLDDAKALCSALREAGVEARPFWKPVHIQTPYKDVPKSSMRITEAVWGRIVTLPCSTNITDSECEYVANIVIKCLE